MLTTLALGLSLACGVPSARAEYETPEVQVYVKGARLVACHRATGRERVVGVRANDRMGTDESSYVTGMVGRRWLWTSMYATFAESSDVQEDTLTDLRTGESVKAVLEDDNLDLEAIALPGVLVLAGSSGVTARFIGGRVEQLSAAPASALAAAGSRLYWTESGATARTALLTLPAADPARAKPLARTVGKCKPRPGARLLVRFDRLVVSRAGGATWACRGTKTRRVSDSADVSVPSDRRVIYPGGQFTVSSGRRDALGGSEPATNGVVAYALDGAGTPQVAPL
jgi:hypothetical protein